MIELVKALNEFIGKNENKVSFNGLVLEFPKDENLIKLFKANGLSIEIDGQVCSFNLGVNNGDRSYFFYNENDFLRRYDSISEFDDSNIYVLRVANTSYWVKTAGLSFDPSFSLLFNFNIYRRILAFILRSTDFISYSIEEKHEFILLDVQGPTEIGYNPLDVRVAQLDNLKPVFERLQEMFEKYEFQQFFKEAVLISIKKVERGDRFYRLIESLSVFLDHAEKDYKIYLKKFAFENIKSKFKEERTKYFESIEKNIDSINKQVTAFPLTFSASVFASYQVKEKPFILFFILLAYALYTFVAWKVLNVSYRNLEGVRNDVNDESAAIKTAGIVIYQEFEEDFNKVYAKLKQLFNLVIILRVVLIFLLVLFMAFVIHQSFFSNVEIALDKIFTGI